MWSNLLKGEGLKVDELKESENILDKIQEIFGNLPENFSILEEQIDIDLQMEYFECSKNFKKSDNEPNVSLLKSKLEDFETSIPDKKDILIKLASIENIEAFRIIEEYLKKDIPALRDWTMLALQESRMLIESKLLDENKVFISTGLGGRGSKLRYFIVAIAKNKLTINKAQKKIIRNEFDFTLRKYNGELEEVNFLGNLSTIKAIVPLKIPIRDLFREAISECNLYGNFLKKNFIVTNVKELSFDEITEFLDNQKDLEIEE